MARTSTLMVTARLDPKQRNLRARSDSARSTLGLHARRDRTGMQPARLGPQPGGATPQPSTPLSNSEAASRGCKATSAASTAAERPARLGAQPGVEGERLEFTSKREGGWKSLPTRTAQPGDGKDPMISVSCWLTIADAFHGGACASPRHVRSPREIRSTASR
jgi:hypothetical protein